MTDLDAELRQFRAFLEASERLLQARTLQEKLDIVAGGVVDSGLFGRCVVSTYHHERTAEAMVGGAGVDATDIARLRREPTLSQETVAALERQGTPLGAHCYYIPAHMLGAHPATVASERSARTFVDWHPDDMFLATLRSARGQLFGFVTADDPPDGRVPTPDSVPTLVLFANLASDLLEREFLLRRDRLTSLYNGAFLNEVLDQLDAPPRAAFAALYADLDNLKRVNDRFGHRAGDQYIVAAGRILRQATGPGAIAFRPYGDEFIAVTADARAFGRARARIAAAVATWNSAERLSLVAFAPGEEQLAAFRLGMSAGAARRRGAEAARQVVTRAENAMYRHKRAARGEGPRRRPR